MKSTVNFIIDKNKCQATTDISTLDRREKVCVVAVIGRGPSGRHKSGFICAFSKKQVFNADELSKREVSSADDLCYIEGSYDSTCSVVYLHLVTNQDSQGLQELSLLAQHGHSFIDVWRQAEHGHTRALLFIFSISHIVLLTSPGMTFDIGYMQLFKTLDALRLKLQPQISDLLYKTKVPEDWVESGRPCSPRVLFLFHTPPPHLNENQQPPSKKNTLRSQQHGLEDLLYRLLRKTRIITNISNNSLFAIPSNQDFVYISDGCDDGILRENSLYFLHQLSADCNKGKPVHSYQASRRSKQSDKSTNPGTRLDEAAAADVKSGQSQDSTETAATAELKSKRLKQGNSFTEFLRPHIELALGKGFDDNVGRHQVAPVFETTTFSVWFEAVERLRAVMLSERWDSKIHNILSSQHDLDLRFSEHRCAKLLSLAEAAYRDGLPPHYTLAFHLRKVEQAELLFSQHARGPASDTYLRRLMENCQNHWLNGRQMCEEISLTGNHCVNQLHRLPDLAVLEDMEHLPVLDHCSEVMTLSYCNCGRTSADRPDPFSHKAANHDFYQALELECCSSLYHHPFLTFTPSPSLQAPPTPAGLEAPPTPGGLDHSHVTPDWKHDSASGVWKEKNQRGVEREGERDKERDRFRHDDGRVVSDLQGGGMYTGEGEGEGYLGGGERLSQDTQGEFSAPVRKDSSKFDFTGGAMSSLSLVLSLEQFEKEGSVCEEYSNIFPSQDDLGPTFLSRTKQTFHNQSSNIDQNMVTGSVDDSPHSDISDADKHDNIHDDKESGDSRLNKLTECVTGARETESMLAVQMTGNAERENVESDTMDKPLSEELNSEPVIQQSVHDSVSKDHESNELIHASSNVVIGRFVEETKASVSAVEESTSYDNKVITDDSVTDAANPSGDEITCDKAAAASSLAHDSSVRPQLLQQQHSTSRYLACMLHSDSSAGLLPLFSSWSLLKLSDDVIVHDPELGVHLDLPGFQNSSPTLLPLDINIENRTDKTGSQSLTLYVGVDYECGRGHRLFINAPDSIHKLINSASLSAVTQSVVSVAETDRKISIQQSTVQGSHDLLSQDLPLYLSCPCRTTSPEVAQLARLYILVPDGDLRVELNVRVQPSPSPSPLFIPEAEGPLCLQSPGLWVLRLPYMYVGESGPYRKPSDPELHSTCVLKKGFIHIS